MYYLNAYYFNKYSMKIHQVICVMRLFSCLHVMSCKLTLEILVQVLG